MSNININRTNVTISPADMATITAALKQVTGILAVYAQALVKEERKKMHKLGAKNGGFVRDAHAQGKLLNPQLPVKMQELVVNLGPDTEFHQQLGTIMNTLVTPLVYMIKDTQLLVGHECYAAALNLYRFIERGSKMGLPGFGASYQILKQRFAKQKGRPAGGKRIF